MSMRASLASVVITVIAFSSVKAQETPPVAKQITVAVVGAVEHPTQQCVLPEGATLIDAIEAVGGFTMFASQNFTHLDHLDGDGKLQSTRVDVKYLRRKNLKGPTLSNGDKVTAVVVY